MSVAAAELRYRLHGVTIRVACDASALAARVNAFLTHFGLEADGEEGGAPDLELRLQVGEPPRPATAEGWEPLAGMGISVVRRGYPPAVRSAEAVVHLAPQLGRASGHVAPAAAAAGSLNMNVVSYALLSLLRHRDLFPLHAAGVAWKGVGMLLVADSGAGKSTLAVSLLASGWSLLSDDSLLLASGEGGVEALAVRRELFLRPRPGKAGDELNSGPWPDAGKLRLDPRARFPQLAIERCTPHCLVFPTLVDQATSRLEPCPHSEALQLLAHHGLVTDLHVDRTPRHVEVLAALVRQCSAHRLLAARDLLDDRALASRLLAPLCENAR